MNPDLKIPFTQDGHMAQQIGYGGQYVLRNNYAFTAYLRFVTFYPTRSSALAILEDTLSGSRYYMYLSEFEKIMSDFENGIIFGHWTFYKKGSAFTLGLVR